MSQLRLIALLFSIAIGAAPAFAHVVVDPAGAAVGDVADDDFGGAADEADEGDDHDDDGDDDDERGLWRGAVLGHTLTERVLEGEEPDSVVASSGQRLLRPPR